MNNSELLAAGLVPLCDLKEFIKTKFNDTLPNAELPKPTSKKKICKFKRDQADPNKEMSHSLSINGGRL